MSGRFPTFSWLSQLLLVTCLSACGSETPSLPASPPVASSTSAQSVVQTHDRGVFYNAKLLQQQALQLANATRPSVHSLEPVNLMDTSGFGQSVVAAMIRAPTGWIIQGGVEWNRSVECAGNTHGFNWTATSTDGMHQLSLLSKMTWQVESAPAGVVPLNPCPAAPMRSARDFLEFLARNTRSHVQVLDYRERADLVVALQNGTQPPAAPEARISYDAGELLIGYSQQGHLMRESLVTTVTFSELQGSIVAWTDHVFALRAPDGLLDFAVLEEIRQSFQLDQVWAGQMLAWTRNHVEALNQRQIRSIQEWHSRRMAEINMSGMAARHQIRMDTIAQIGQINNQIVANTSATNDRAHAGFIDSIQEVQPWRDPSTGSQVDLSIHYSNAWQLSDGRQFLTNDASFDPARDLGIEGQRLEPAPPP